MHISHTSCIFFDTNEIYLLLILGSIEQTEDEEEGREASTPLSLQGYPNP